MAMFGFSWLNTAKNRNWRLLPLTAIISCIVSFFKSLIKHGVLALKGNARLSQFGLGKWQKGNLHFLIGSLGGRNCCTIGQQPNRNKIIFNINAFNAFSLRVFFYIFYNNNNPGMPFRNNKQLVGRKFSKFIFWRYLETVQKWIKLEFRHLKNVSWIINYSLFSRNSSKTLYNVEHVFGILQVWHSKT